MNILSIGTNRTDYNLSVEDYVFKDIKDTTDITEIQEIADSFFSYNNIGEDTQINLYVTENTLFTLAVVKSSIKAKCKLNCMHYISNLGCYIAQPIL